MPNAECRVPNADAECRMPRNPNGLYISFLKNECFHKESSKEIGICFNVLGFGYVLMAAKMIFEKELTQF